MANVTIGIDPGAKGAVAVLIGKEVVVYDTPYTKATKKDKGGYDIASMAAIIRPYCMYEHPVHVIIESVHAMPGQGVTSMFNFGKGLGIWLGILAMSQIPYTLVAPVRWKKVMLADMGAEKTQARIRAQQVFPTFAHLFSRVKDDGRAEAALMAEYGRRLVHVDAPVVKKGKKRG